MLRLDASFDGLSRKDGLMFHGNFVGNTMVFFFKDKFSFSVDFPRKAIEIRYGIYDTNVFFVLIDGKTKHLQGRHLVSKPFQTWKFRPTAHLRASIPSMGCLGSFEVAFSQGQN